MYLPPEAVSDLFFQAAAITGPPCKIVFTYVPTGKDGGPDAGKWTGLVLWIMRSSGEPWLWSIPPGKLGDYLNKTGWTYASGIEGTGRCGVEYLGVATK